jgi:hypothetical protein
MCIQISVTGPAPPAARSASSKHALPNSAWNRPPDRPDREVLAARARTGSGKAQQVSAVSEPFRMI